jgi:basic membrane lipoprotein Med (substrate-binding protein (PBP1-ABC) superfamily)
MKHYVKPIHIMMTLLVLFSVVLSGCGGQKAASKVFKVGLLSPGTVHDQGWNELAYQAIMLIKDKMGAEVSYVEISDSPSDIEKAFRDYASQGYNMIIGHSYVHQDAAAIVAKDYPNTIFLTSGGDKKGPNYGPVIFKENEAMYLLGIIGAQMTKTGKAIGIGGEEIPAISLPSDGFKAGFETVAGNSYTVTYINSWDDIVTGKEAALAGIAAGADIVIPNANIAGQGAFQAAEEKGIYAFGTNTDQSAVSPTTILASTVFNYAQAYLAIAETIKAGTFVGNKVFSVGLEDPNAEYIAYNPALKDKIPADLLTLVETTRQKIVSGEIVVPGNMIP